MSKVSVRRIVVELVAFLFRDSIIPPAYFIGRLLFPGIVADSAAMEKIFTESDLDWTMVRPPELTNKPYTGRYRVREGHLPAFGFKISRADVADYMIKAAEDHLSSRKIVGFPTSERRETPATKLRGINIAEIYRCHAQSKRSGA
jgi:hypothetical protein